MVEKNKHAICLIVFSLTIVINLVTKVNAGCPVTDNPSQMFQCLTINPQAFIDLISKGDYKSFCHMANGYMTCMTTYVRDCLGGKAATGILEELQDLNLKCCISSRSQECVVKNPALLQKCFSADNTVMMSNGNKKNIMDVAIGDLVKAIDSNGDIVDSEVVSILHKNHNDTTMFQSFYDSNNNYISLTGEHLINVKGRGYVKAKQIKIGDKLRVYSNDDKQFYDFEVKKILNEMKLGFVAPLTYKGTILVNQIDTSCYAQINDHDLADLAMTPVKLWYKIKKFFGLNKGTSRQIRDNIDISFYSNLLYKITSTIMPSLF